MYEIDARGLSCPEPVLLCQQAYQKGELPCTVYVSDATPKENIIRFAESHGLQVELSETADGYRLELSK